MHRTGKLPPIDDLLAEEVVVDGAWQVEHIGGVKNMPSIKGQGSVVIRELEGIERRTGTLSVVVVSAANSKRMTPCIVDVEHGSAGLLHPLHD